MSWDWRVHNYDVTLSPMAWFAVNPMHTNSSTRKTGFTAYFHAKPKAVSAYFFAWQCSNLTDYWFWSLWYTVQIDGYKLYLFIKIGSGIVSIASVNYFAFSTCPQLPMIRFESVALQYEQHSWGSFFYTRWLSSKHKTLNKCWINVGPAS